MANVANTGAWQAPSGALLILGTALFFPSGILFTGRAIWKWQLAAAPGYLVWERAFVMAALLAVVLGFTLLERALEVAGDSVLAPLALTTYTVSAALGFAAETSFLGKEDWPYATVVAHIVLAFLAQAAFGAALIVTGYLSAWVGWASLIWNLAWLVILPIRRRDIYYPWLHYVAPLLIGIMLLTRI